jgi:hypothetical protein
MSVRLTLAMPQSALESLMDGYRSGDPKLAALLAEFGVLAIVPHDEQAIASWENEGGK